MTNEQTYILDDYLLHSSPVADFPSDTIWLNYYPSGFTQVLPIIKKTYILYVSLWLSSGEYRGRTDDLLHAMQAL